MRACWAGPAGAGTPPAERIHALSERAAADLVAAAQPRLGRQTRTELGRGLADRLVVAAAQGADLLVVARDGDGSRLGPASLGPAARFVVDHAPCPVLLVWPDETPGVRVDPTAAPAPAPTKADGAPTPATSELTILLAVPQAAPGLHRTGDCFGGSKHQGCQPGALSVEEPTGPAGGWLGGSCRDG